jgi:tRNA pseudouridine38-40 synthase
MATLLNICSPLDALSTRYRARVAYDGAGFHGFQRQSENSNHRTIQLELETHLSQRCQQPVCVVGAGRTDAGVHARGQAIHFDLNDNNTNINLDVTDIERAMRSMLPQDVRLYNLQKAPDPTIKIIGNSANSCAFHVMYDATSKLYVYRLALNNMHPMDRHNRHLPDNAHLIDPDQLQRVLQYFVGEHDVRAFAGAVDANVSTVRTIYKADLVQEEYSAGYYRIEFLLKGALYKQVRNMVGTALDVCLGRLTERAFLALLQNGKTRNDNKSRPAPPHGLTLEQVFFDDGDETF